METIDDAIREFVKNRVGGVIVNEESGRICYQDSRILLSPKGIESWNRKRPLINERKTWEFTDLEADKYYRIETATVTTATNTYQCHLFTDISDYATLFQDISDYSKRISDLSDFQKSILAMLSQDYDSFLPELTQFCGATDSILYMKQSDSNYVRRSSYSERLLRNNIPLSSEIEGLFQTDRFDFSDGYYCFLSERIQEDSYALFLRRGVEFNEEYFRDASVYNVIRLFIENGVLREKIRYESEHDGLTGLFNKGKFLSMKDNQFNHPSSIAVCMFDINNLKQVNDNLGHEAGDALIVAASQSILSITDDEVYGFRMGGDEFAVIAPNITREKMDAMIKTWSNALNDINKIYQGDTITIAVGYEYATSPYDLDKLLASADEKMYENKKYLKKKLGLPERG